MNGKSAGKLRPILATWVCVAGIVLQSNSVLAQQDQHRTIVRILLLLWSVRKLWPTLPSLCH